MEEFFIPENEFSERIQRLQNVIANKKEVDAILIFSTESEPAGVRYFSDYWPSFESAAVFVPGTGEPVLLIGPESMTFAASRSKIKKIIKMKDFRESSQPDYPGTTLMSWKELLNNLNIKKIGISGWYMFPHVIFENIANVIGRNNILEADELVRRVTLKKSNTELKCLKEAARISELGFKSVLENIKPGMTEAQLVGVATAAMMANGAEATGYPVWCCSGPNSIQAISRPTHRKVKEGEIIHFSIGAKVAGYSASIGRPVVLGKCDNEMLRFLQTGLDAENMTIELMIAGARAGDIAKKVHGYIKEKGYEDTILYGPAHGCGQMECEFPFIESSSEFVLEEGMVFMVDIFLAKPTMGFRWEDGVIITDNKAEELSNFKRKINIL
ncbi:MAG: Xaa-Pro peptidase family protein [Petrimonas sp.]|nr:Xaa-Pro peptidase family protein [Petrimonas sp.]